MRSAPGGSWRRSGSADHQIPSDDKMRAWRLAGQFICTCGAPSPRTLGAFAARECIRCWKPILHRDSVTEVITGVLGEVEA